MSCSVRAFSCSETQMVGAKLESQSREEKVSLSEPFCLLVLLDRIDQLAKVTRSHPKKKVQNGAAL